MKNTDEMFRDACLFDEKDVEARVRLAMYYLQTERFERVLCKARNEHGNAIYDYAIDRSLGAEQYHKSVLYAAGLWRKLGLRRMSLEPTRVQGNREMGDLSFVGLTHFLMGHRDIVEQIENEYGL